MKPLKRLFDLFLTLPALILLIPLLVAVAIVIKIDDRGPVFFLQERVGCRGKKFLLWKFRSMTPAGARTGIAKKTGIHFPSSHSDPDLNIAFSKNPPCFPVSGERDFHPDPPPPAIFPQLTVGEDPRITRAGRWLRRTKIDELPQLINVLRGEMSLVGPRPEVPRYVARYTEEQRRVLELVPGITDPASIKYRYESDLLAQSLYPEQTYIKQIMPEKILLNLDYAGQATLCTDFKIILATLRLVLKG